MSVQVQINVINQLRLLRQSTFKDPLAFLDEDVQNAQRAKATQVNIEVHPYEKEVVIWNNGEVLDDPQKLFSVAESGWDAETVVNENPFGIGFFSNISVSDFLVIHTGNQKITFDVAKMLSTGDTTVQVENISEFFNGFKLVLRNFDFSEIRSSHIEERARMLGKFVQDLDIVYEDELIERKDPTQIDTNSPFAMSVSEESCKGWIALASGFSSEIKLFYKGRYVTSLDQYYCEGELHLSDKAVNLVAPDRKDIIRDSKYSAFKNLIREYLEEIATDAALVGKHRDQEEYSDAIAWYADVSKAKDSMKFTIVKCDDNGVKYLKDIIQGNRKDDAEGNGATALNVNEDAIQSESHFEEVVVETEIVNAPTSSRSGSTGSYYSGESLVPDELQKDEMGSSLFTVERPKFWVSMQELRKYESKVLVCKHYDLCLVLAKNKFQDRVLAALEKEGKVFHISTLEERIKVHVTLSNTTPFKREERAVMLFDMLSRMVGKSHNVFALGDLMVVRILELPEINVAEERIEEDIKAIYCEDYDKVYVDRTLLRGVQLLEHSNPRLALSDYKFILANLPILVEELSFAVKMSPTKISNTILKTLGGE